MRKNRISELSTSLFLESILLRPVIVNMLKYLRGRYFMRYFVNLLISNLLSQIIKAATYLKI